MDGANLPHVDEHTRRVAASVDETWAALLQVVHRGLNTPFGRRYARWVGCDDTWASARFPDPGATLPGFHVAVCSSPHTLELRGRHRFARYMLRFELAPAAGACRLTARTDASFSGFGGRLYAALVIGTRGHVVAVRRMLRSVARRAERSGQQVES